eukprot:Hpha_TRINITY_DN1782_c0_g1::TRINITY_DN1782_c0_g1_i1::g.158537::m.158537
MGCGASARRRGSRVADASAARRESLGRKRRSSITSPWFLRQLGGVIVDTDATPHSNPVYCVRWTPCGRFIMSTSRDGSVTLWSSEFGYKLRGWQAHKGHALSCAISPLKDVFVSTSDDKTARVWPLNHSGDPLTLSGHSNKVYCCDFTKSTQQVLTCSMDHYLKLWDVSTGSAISTLAGHSKAVFSCSCLSDTAFASGGDDRVIRLWDSRQKDPTASLDGHSKTVWCVRGMESDPNYCLSTGMDSDVREWDLRTRRSVSTFSGHKAPVHVCAYSSDGKNIVSAGRDSHIFVWGRDTGEIVERIRGHDCAIYGAAVFEDQLATCALDETIRIWQLPGSEALKQSAAGLDLEFDLQWEEEPSPCGDDPWAGVGEDSPTERAASPRDNA